MKKALAKSSFREIRATLSRFLSIFGIVALGVGFFAGVKAAAPDMRNTVDEYIDGAKLMDLRIVSTYGFDDNDIAAIEKLEGSKVYPSYFTDLVAHYESRSPAAARLIALNGAVKSGEVNALELAEGRLPENRGECVVSSAKMLGGPSVGDKVVFKDNNGGVPDDMISVNEYTIVGKVRTAMYIDKTSRGSTSVGNGSIESVFFIPEENFCVEYNTEVYVRFPEFDGLNCYSSEYKDAIEALADRAEDIGEVRAVERFDDIKREADEKLADAQAELDDAEREYNEKIADGEKELADGEAEIAENERKLIDGEAEIAENEQKLIDAQAEIAENEQKLIDAQAEIADGEKKLADGEKELADNEKKIIDGEKEIEANEKKLADAQKQYDDGYAEYTDGLRKYNDGLAQYEAGLKEYNTKKAELEDGKKQYDDGIAALAAGKKQLAEQKAQLEAALAQAAAAMGVPAITDEMLAQLAQTSPEMAQLAAGKQTIAAAEAEAAQKEAALAAAKAQLDEGEKQLADGETQLAMGKAVLDEGRKQLDDGEKELAAAKTEIDNGRAELAKARAELEDGKKKLADGKKEFEDNRKKLEDAKREFENGTREIEDAKQEVADGWVELNDGKKELEDGKKELADGKVKLEDGRKELEDGKKEGAEKIADAKEKLADAREEIDDLSKPKWYVFTRRDNPGFTEYGENADRINNIALVFPVFFIIVAMLVCLTTMSRMVEEQRVGIGTLKALGYGNGSIMFKYMFYAVSATVIGSVFGVIVGMHLFPYVIIAAYGMMYDIPNMSLSIDIVTALVSSLVFIAAIGLTVFLTTHSALSEQAAQLMRPKTPKNGKRILLEHITPVWKRFGFSGKVTARNLFRYKRKMLMTVIGISGCTALLMTGLALYDAINDILAKQFYDIQNYDGILAYDREEHPEAVEKAAALISAKGGESIQVYQKLIKVNSGGRSVNAYIAVPTEPDRFTDFFDLRSRITGEKYRLTDDTIYIDEKTTLLLDNISGGDTVEIEKSETEKFPVTITAAFENYPNHYVYMTPGGYESRFGEKPEYNVIYFRHGLGTGDAQNSFGEELLKIEGALNVTFNSDTMVTFTNMLETLSMVIMVIIASAGLLAFVVMYNLTNINITERIREIATLKVLGFYDGEVDSYVFRENILLALLGTGAGLVLGIFLARFVITTAEVDIVMFGRNIYPMSYILSALITMAFSVLVTVAMHKRLKDINMIEALKSVE